MADLQSLGLHQPSGLHYLIAEGFLSESAKQEDYHRVQGLFIDENGSLASEEVLATDTCVVWSRHGSIKRVFNLEVEDEQILHAFPTSFSPLTSRTHSLETSQVDVGDSKKEPALVVVLKTQAHIFCLSGAIHVIPLAFQVARAFSSLYGCLLQPSATAKQYPLHRQESRDDPALLSSQHSFVKSFLQPSNARDAAVSMKTPRKQATFCITDLLADVGIVAVNYSRRPKDAANQPLLPADEEILFVSNAAHTNTQALKDVCVAVTVNHTASTITIWHVQQTTRASQNHKVGPETTSYRQRQSSNYQERPRLASGRTVAGPSRESFGGLMQSFIEPEPKQSMSQLLNIEHLAAELGQDFESAGVQTRSARRISSMLARTDLAPATERSTYNDSTVPSRKSLSRSLRHEGSFGSFTDRNSINARRSFPAEASTYSNNTSFLDAGLRVSINEGIGGNVEGAEYDRAYAQLEKSLMFVKVKSFACHESSKGAATDKFKVLLIPHPFCANLENDTPNQLSVCIHESVPGDMTVVTIAIKKPDLGKTNGGHAQDSSSELKSIQVQKGSNIADACLVREAEIIRILMLTKTSNGDDVLHLEAPWSTPFRIDLPEKYFAHSPYHSTVIDRFGLNTSAGSGRTINSSDVRIAGFLDIFNMSVFTFEDKSGRLHDLRISMQPSGDLERSIIDVGTFVLPTPLQDSLLVAYWEVARWLKSQDQQSFEHVAITIVLFILAIPFIAALHNAPPTPSRKKKSLGKRLSSGTLADHANWKLMQSAELTRQSPSWMQSQAWSWMNSNDQQTTTSRDRAVVMGPPQVDKHVAHGDYSTWLSHCTHLARDFLQSPAGEHMNGPEGYLPTAINQDRNTRRTALATLTVALHLLLEELRLKSPSDMSLMNAVNSTRVITMQLSSWLGWPSWTNKLQQDLHLSTIISEPFILNTSKIDGIEIPAEPFSPLSLYELLDSSQSGSPIRYHSLAELLRNLEHLDSKHPTWMRSAQLLPLSTRLIDVAKKQVDPCLPVDSTWRNSMQGVVLGIYNENKQSQQPLSGRNQFNSTKASRSTVVSNSSSRNQNHKATRDVRAICNQALDAESTGRWDVSSETNQQVLTKLLFNQDRRFQEASRLVNQARASEIEYDPQPNWTEADALEAQKLLAQYATRRTFAVVSGRGLMHYNARTPLLTEMIPRAQFSMTCILKPKTETEGVQAMTFSADRSLFAEDKVSWAFFHNGASAGLMISKAVQFIDTSWILYNKPPELTNRHAGFLLALGLNGHLKNLAKWVAFKYLTPKHTMTSIGLLLGLAASYRGTADTLITRLLSVHITCLLPSGAAELNLSPLTQVTGLVGIGLLYHDRQHRRMSEIMISEIECQEPEERSGEEPMLRDEGYRLAAGIALGLINLGHGLRLHSLQDMRVVERLLAIAIGPKNVNLVHVLDRATAGAVIAIALVFMKTNDASIASKIDIPDTSHQFEYVRPDIFLLRTLARHLIMWKNIRPEHKFIEASLPPQYRHRAGLQHLKQLFTNDLAFFHVIAGICFAIGLKYAGSRNADARDILVYYLDQFLRISRLSSASYDAKVTLNGIRNCLDILALSCATVMAGSGDIEVYRRLRALHGRIDKDTPFGSHLAAHMAIGALFLSGGAATFGTSNLAVASLVIAFYPLFPTDVLDNRGHLQALRHLWVLAVEHRCLYFRNTSNGQILGDMKVRVELLDESSLIMQTPSLLPELNTVKSIEVTDESYWSKRLDLDEKLDSAHHRRTVSQTFREFYQASSTGIVIDLVPRALYDHPTADTFLSEIHAQNLSTASFLLEQNAELVNHTAIASGPRLGDWIFDLPAFQGLDHAERDLILSGNNHFAKDTTGVNANYGSTLLATTPVDTRLELEVGVLGPETVPSSMRQPLKQDKIWQIRLLLSWANKLEQEIRDEEKSSGQGQRRTDKDQRFTWVRHEVIERLRWRVWQMSPATTGDAEP